MKKQSKSLKQFLQTVQEYNNFNKYVAENKEKFLGKHYLFTRNKNHRYKHMINEHESIIDYQFDTYFKYDCSCVRYWENPLDTYWKNEVLTVSNINDKGLVQFYGRDDNEYSIHSLFVFDEVSEEFKNKFNTSSEKDKMALSINI